MPVRDSFAAAVATALASMVFLIATQPEQVDGVTAPQAQEQVQVQEFDQPTLALAESLAAVAHGLASFTTP